MEIVEKKYRDTSIDNKKYALRLTNFIEYLLSNGKIIEAKHYFRSLLEAKLNHARTIRLGYLLSIATFDNEGVRKFDELLYKSKPKDIEIYWFRLKYYLSVNDYKNCEDCCTLLLSKPIKKEYLKTVIEACLRLNNYVIASQLVKYLKKEKIILSEIGNKNLKKIILEKLINELLKVKCA
ncbi:MAG: hypothetical protein U0998_05985 [Moraxellaceae bacterium]|nr:hypothetical protein [Moraxellaceae bacterium]MDZ4386757.1 hypothetical protein [Moraxellaceae bacterium]